MFFLMKIMRIPNFWMHQAVPISQAAAAAAPQTSRVVSESAEAENNSWERQRLRLLLGAMKPGSEWVAIIY